MMANFTDENIKTVLDRAYPVGAYYKSDDSTNPGDIFGGSWTQVTGKFLRASGKTGSSGSATSTIANVPAHSHTANSHSHTITNHKHGVTENHIHSVTFTTQNHSHSSKTSPGNHYHTISFNYATGTGKGVPWSGSGNMYACSNADHALTLSMTGIADSNNTMGTDYDIGGTENYTAPNGPSSGGVNGGTWDTYYENVSTNSVGSGSAVNIMPPRKSCYIWKRVS